MQAEMELKQLLEEIEKNGFRPIGIIFSDPKFGLLGIAPSSDVPDEFVEMIGQRLSGVSRPQWQPLGTA